MKFKISSITETSEKFLHSAYLIYILVTLGALLIDMKDTDIRGIILTVALCVFLFYLVAYDIFLTHKLGKKSKYAEAQKPLHSCIHELRNIYVYLSNCVSNDPKHENENFSEELFITKLQTALTSFNDAFIISSSVGCRASIKLLGAVDKNLESAHGEITDNLFLKTLARDKVSAERKKDVDSCENHKHLLNKNSDFQSLYQGDLDYYFNGQLWKDTSYRNSNDQNIQSGIEKRKDYNSTIVWPIRYKLSTPQAQESSGKINLILGFLTLDALPAEAFEERYDVEMGASVADALYIVLDKYREYKNSLE
jgi:YHS domain-containing protein